MTLISIATISIYLEEKYKLFKKLTGALVAMMLGMLLSNIGFLPTASASYDLIWEYIVPLTIPLLLMKINVKTIVKEAGSLFWAFHLSALGTIVGSIIAVALLYNAVPHLAQIVPAMTGSYIGGSINFVALVAAFEPPEDLVNATIVADNGIMAIYFILLIALPSMPLIRKLFPRINEAKFKKAEDSATANSDENSKQITLLDIGFVLTIAFVITAMSVLISDYFSADRFSGIVRGLLGQKYILLTTFSMLFPILFPKFAKTLNGNNEIGVFFIFLFFVLIGVPASIKTVIVGAPIMLIFCAIILAFNFLVTFSLGKLFKFELEDLVMAAIVTSGGPMNGVAIAKAKGWNAYIVPSLLMGIWGYIIGNYTGYFAGLILENIF
ncbi:membrane protein [Portibacter lacus]|uniref:Membrane protein n=2 Tax=Portibacter lacus TaxID=1099794 RepID=A0AA37ST44_9BACT|nr:membrane protein [Portibacter lacus]